MHELGSTKHISRFGSKKNVTEHVFETLNERMKGKRDAFTGHKQRNKVALI